MSTLDRTHPPSSGTMRAFDFPTVERLALPTGLDLRVAIMNRLPMVSLNLFMHAGEAALAPETAGLAVLTADALEGGTKKGPSWRSRWSGSVRARPPTPGGRERASAFPVLPSGCRRRSPFSRR